MAKETGAYESLIRGVSEQVPHDRLPGQHWLQDNFISDPVRGLARRHGSVMVHERKYSTLSLSAASKADMTNFKEASFTVNGKELSFLYRPVAKVAGSTMPGLVAIDKDAGQILSVQAGASDSVALDILDKGITTITAVGQFILFGARGRVTTYSGSDRLAATSTYAVAWVRGGAYSRKYTITIVKPDNSVVTVNYTTPASYYEGTLNTSDIPATATDYQKQVNDRVNAYNTAVNQHIASAGRAIQPENIAESLRAACVSAGFTTVTRVGAMLRFTGVKNVVADDNGDGGLFKATAQEVESTNDLSNYHVVGKTVRVTPKRNDYSTGQNTSFYLKARPVTEGMTGWQDVVWEEAPGYEVTPNFMFLMGWYNASNGTLYVGSTAANLAAVSGLSDVPTFSVSSAGDADSSPIPEFFGKQIDYMRTFQDRLMIVAGATVFMSKSGDYFNFFRKSVLTLADDDPIEVYADGSEGDTITCAVQLDRNLLLFGKRQQYAVPGREAMTPRNAYIATQSAHEDAIDAPPVASGNLIFFSQQRSNRLTVHQMMTGAYADSFESFDVTQQLDGYMIGTPRQIVAMTAPTQLFIRTKELTNGVYVFSYLDSLGSEQRLFDSWSRWTWNPNLGTLVGITSHDSNLLTVTARQAPDGVYLVLDRFVRESRLSSNPYLDSMRPWSVVSGQVGTIETNWVGAADTAVVFKETAGEYFLLGRPLAEASTLFSSVPGQEAHAMVGTYFESDVEPTNPYIRDRQDKAVLDGRLTVGKLMVTVADTAAMNATITAHGTSNMVLEWVYRPAGSWILNKQQIAEATSVTVPVMKEIRDYRLRLSSRNWLPLTVSSIEWQGQFFTSRRG